MTQLSIRRTSCAIAAFCLLAASGGVYAAPFF